MKQEISILLAFLKDKLSLMALFIINTAVIILFFDLALDSTEWFYPGCLSAVIFIPFLFVQYYSYRKLMLMCHIGEVNLPEEVYSNKEYMKKINSTLFKIHKSYNVRLNEEKQKNLEFRRFISQFVHAMKTPVTVIKLAVQKSGEAECEHSNGCSFTEIMQDISEENQRQLDMLNNLLDYLRINEFNKDYMPAAVDLHSELTRLINSKKRSFIYNNVRPNIISNVEENTEVLTDVKWNSVMLDQIISNAIKYSNAENEMKKIDFIIKKTEDKTILSIQDYGIGIPEHDLGKIDEPFFTGENGRKMKNATGIGLYLVRLISQDLGHEVIVESKAGSGTCVSIIYPNRKV